MLAAALGGGLYRIRGDQEEERRSGRESALSSIRTMLVDRSGDAWLGTEGRGLCRLALAGGAALDGAAASCLGEAEGYIESSLVYVR